MIDFIGIGAQKSGTSWVHACLFEHPEVCSPIKEIHFFSRERFAKGKDWYENHFKECSQMKKKGEFSTSYLYSEEAGKRIISMYPDVKTIAVLREPAARAYSQYRNAIKAGEITTETSFDTYLEQEKSCIAQGQYSMQLQRYYKVFDTSQVLVLIYENIAKDPQKFIQAIYWHIGVDETFVPPSLEKQINIARTPKHTKVDSVMHKTAEWLRKHGASHLVHIIKSSGITDAVRSVNTKGDNRDDFDVTPYKKYFAGDVQQLSDLLGRDLVKEWDYE